MSAPDSLSHSHFPRLVPRPGLAAWILAQPTPLVVIEAAAGMGKSCLLAELARALGAQVASGPVPPDGPLWDIPPGCAPAPIPESRVAEGPGQLILAKRPDSALHGLARADVYGKVTHLRDADLFLTQADLIGAGWSPEHAAQAIAATGGWPCLLRLAGRDQAPLMTDFLRDELLASLPPAALVAFETLLRHPRTRIARKLLRLVPFATPEQPLHPAVVAVRTPLEAALRQARTRAEADPVAARALGTALAAMGRVPEAIETFQAIGAWRAAIDTLRADGGPFYIHRHGQDAFDRMLAGFAPDMLREDDTLVTCQAIQAVKRGGIATCLRILSERWPGAADPIALMSDDSIALESRFFRFLIMTWQDFDLTPALLDAAWRLHAEIPADDDLRRGSFSNAVLEFYIRSRRFAEAEHEANRAAAHYARAGIPILSFYVELHRAIIALIQGKVKSARRHGVAARAHLRATPYDSPGDARLLALIEACIDYEQGRTDPLSAFLSLETDALAQGEIWPTLVELVLIYGSQALGERRSTLAARAFLDRWRVVGARSDQFQALIDIREVLVLQNGNRWSEADRRARAITSRITPEALLANSPDWVTALSDRDEVTMALAWLRQMAWLSPRREGLEPLLAAMIDNAALTQRQRLCAEIWRAHVLRRQRRTPEAQSVLLRVLDSADEAGALGILGEERAFLRDLTATHSMRAALDRSRSAQQALRAAQAAGPGRLARAQAQGLTRQETRILHALAEGGGNKAMANGLGLSESTVKFHLSNLYRKLGTTTRRGALSAAQALGLLS